MLRPSFGSSTIQLCLWNNPASLPGWASPRKPPAPVVEADSSLGFSKHRCARQGHLGGQEETQQMYRGKCHTPPRHWCLQREPCWFHQTSDPQPSPVSTMHLTRNWSVGCHEHGADAAGMDAWAWNQNPNVSKKGKRHQASQSSSCLHRHWDSRVERTGAQQLPQTGKPWLRRDCGAIGREWGGWEQVSFPSAAIANHSHGQEPGPGPDSPKGSCRWAWWKSHPSELLHW